MGRSHPDDLISALSKHLKAPSAPVLRFTFKCGALWQPQFAKAHSRKAKAEVKRQLKTQAANASPQSVWPLLARFKSNEKQEIQRINSQLHEGKGTQFIQSLMSVFRVNFFKKKEEDKQKEKKGPTKADPASKSSQRRQQKHARNQERRNKRAALKRSKRRGEAVTEMVETK